MVQFYVCFFSFTIDFVLKLIVILVSSSQFFSHIFPNCWLLLVVDV